MTVGEWSADEHGHPADRGGQRQRPGARRDATAEVGGVAWKVQHHRVEGEGVQPEAGHAPPLPAGEHAGRRDVRCRVRRVRRRRSVGVLAELRRVVA
jgi:hypothetical protein